MLLSGTVSAYFQNYRYQEKKKNYDNFMINTDVPNILKENFVKNVPFEILRCLIRIPKFFEVGSRSGKSILKEKNKKYIKNGV
jgi:hypothetical protein